MSFLNNLVNEFTHHGQQQEQGQGFQGGYNQQSYNNNSGGRPNPPEPWTTEWDYERNTWVFINRQTGQRTHEFPRGGGEYSQTTTYEQVSYNQPPEHKDHSTRNTALGVAAGLAGGAFLMHEGHEAEERWDEDKERVEDRFDYDRDRVEDRVEYDKYRAEDKVYDGVQDVEDFPEDAARWTGRKVEEVEDIPEDVADWTGRKVQEVEDIPEDVAGWAGRRVEGVERFGDEIRDSYDDGRAQQEFRDDERYNNNW